MTRPLKHFTNNLFATLAVVDLLDNTLVNGLTLTSETRGQLESGPLNLRHDQKLLNDGFDQLDSTCTSLDMMVVVMPILLDTVQRIFVLILSVGNKARIFGFPSRMRGPRVVQNGVAKLITTTARFLTLTLR